MSVKYMKDVQEVVACVVDYGTFTALADKLSETMKTVYYHSPTEKEYKSINDAMTGEGLSKVIKLHDLFDPAVFDTIDLFVFPDIGYGGLQVHLKSIGKSVWGSMGADQLELYRDLFLEVLKDAGLPTIKSKVIVGLTALANYLKNVEDKWIKINSYRENMETWHHLDYLHSTRKLETLAVVFGGAREEVTFVVQNSIPSEIELGYDGWCIDGKFPSKSFQGYEKKNELYLGSVLDNKDIPEEITYVNEKMAPVLQDYGYRNWWATEIRVCEGVPYFIDPTCRHPGQTGEHQWESCSNLAEIIWAGSNGIVLIPTFKYNFAAEATLHYNVSQDSAMILEEWKVLDIPKKARAFIKPYHYCIIDGIHHFMPSKKDEVGVILGFGNNIQKAIDSLEKNLELVKHLPVYANTDGFSELLDCIEEAKKYGIKFS